jgi:hypothetical protein
MIALAESRRCGCAVPADRPPARAEVQSRFNTRWRVLTGTPKRTQGYGRLIAGHSVGDGGDRVSGTPTPMTAACIGPEAAVDVLKDALSY